MKVHYRHPEKIDATICKQLIKTKGGRTLPVTTEEANVTCWQCNARLRVIQRKDEIVSVLRESPKPREKIGKMPGMYKLHEYMADLTAEGVIRSNRKTGCFEVVQ